MSTLHDRLADLAQDAPPALPDPGLWDVARGYHRRRRLGTAVVAGATVLALALIGGLGWVRADDGIEPAAPGARPALPDTIWEPSRWLPGTDDEGPLGQLAALLPAERGGWTGAEEAVVGVSAATGEYRFLDLPDDARRDHALSPDGVHVAYWVTGATEGTPQTAGGQYLPATGVAVHDTVTGATVRHDVSTEHGLAPDELIWSDSDTLVLSYGQEYVGDDAPARKQGGSTPSDGLMTWEPDVEEEPTLTNVEAGAVETSNGRGALLVQLDDGMVRWDVETGAVTRLPLPGRLMAEVAALDRTGQRAAYPRGNPSPNGISVVRLVGPQETAESSPVPGADTFAVLAWLDAQHVLAERYAPDELHTDLQRVDVTTGESETVVDLPGPGNFRGELAVGLLDEPFASHPAPPRPLDPRLLVGLSAGLVLIVGVALRRWRSRVRP